MSLAPRLELPPKPSTPIPLHIVGGLYGSGKTTFIQHQVDHAWVGEKLGVILCEEGAAKLDFSRTQPPCVQRLLNACVCCEMAYTFFEVILKFLRDSSIQRLVVEITAQADIQQIFNFIRSSYLRDYLAFEAIHVLVDLRNPHMRPDTPAPLVRRLLQQANVYVLNFHDQPSARDFNAEGKPWILCPRPGPSLR